MSIASGLEAEFALDGIAVRKVHVGQTILPGVSFVPGGLADISRCAGNSRENTFIQRGRISSASFVRSHRHVDDVADLHRTLAAADRVSNRSSLHGDDLAH